MKFLKSVDELKESLDDKQVELVVLDVRSHLQDPDSGREKYEAGHIPGAYYLHLADDLSSEVKEHGGNHPLPDLEVFSKKLAELGITKDSTVVVYDDKNNTFAPRAWWLLRYVGVEKSYVLAGGFRAWEEVGYEVTKEIPAKNPVTFTPDVQENNTVTMEEVRDRNRDNTVLIDSRAFERYIGKTEPLYDKKGHIPGAKNYFWLDLYDEAGNWKSKEALMDHFAGLQDAEEIIVSCGSGISATPNILALKMLGFDNVKLYPGSFSDWISYEANEVETKEE